MLCVCVWIMTMFFLQLLLLLFGREINIILPKKKKSNIMIHKPVVCLCMDVWMSPCYFSFIFGCSNTESIHNEWMEDLHPILAFIYTSGILASLDITKTTIYLSIYLSFFLYTLPIMAILDIWTKQLTKRNIQKSVFFGRVVVVVVWCSSFFLHLHLRSCCRHLFDCVVENQIWWRSNDHHHIAGFLPRYLLYFFSNVCLYKGGAYLSLLSSCCCSPMVILKLMMIFSLLDTHTSMNGYGSSLCYI